MVWPRQKNARGENTKINYGMDTTGEKIKVDVQEILVYLNYKTTTRHNAPTGIKF
jgi:hypothetical protein